MKLRKIVMGSGLILMAVACVLYLLLLAGVWMMQEQIMFGRRTQELLTTPEARGWSFEEVWVDVGGEQSHGWWLPVADAAGVVLFSHGSGRNISGYLEDAALFRDLALSVLLYDYGGYGLSTGQPSEARCYADLRAMWDYLVSTRGIDPHTIILAGSSLGGGVTCELAGQVSPAAVILESTFTSVPNALWDTFPFLPVNWLCQIGFHNIEKVGAIQCPVLIMHSPEDSVVPFAHSQQLYERVTAPKAFVELRGAHYGGKFRSREIYLQGLKTFLTQHTHLGAFGGQQLLECDILDTNL